MELVRQIRLVASNKAFSGLILRVDSPGDSSVICHLDCAFPDGTSASQQSLHLHPFIPASAKCETSDISASNEIVTYHLARLSMSRMTLCSVVFCYSGRYIDFPLHDLSLVSQLYGMQAAMHWPQTSFGGSCGCWQRRSRSLPPWEMLQPQVRSEILFSPGRLLDLLAAPSEGSCAT